MNFFQKMASPFVIFVEKYYPNPFVFVIILTFISFLLVFSLTDTSLSGAIDAWGMGLPKLLAFMAQISITLITAHALAHTKPAEKLLKKLADLPNNPFQAYFLVTLIAGVANLIAWSLGLIVGAIIAKQVAINADKKGISLHYPLLVASAYAGFVLWHMGYSSSSALFVATEGHSLESQMGIIPVTQTIFSNFNIIVALLTLTIISIICPLMHPQKDDIIKIDAEVLENHIDQSKPINDDRKNTVGDLLDNSKILTFLFGFLLLIFLCKWFWNKGLDLNLNIVNWTFLTLGLLLASNTKHFIRLISDASKTVGPILLQFPFYAGIMALLGSSGLIEVMSNWFTQIATADTLSFFAFLSGGIVNMFIPSGGGQWVIQGPIFIEAAQVLGVKPSIIVLAISYGDQWTNMIQPFFTIPLLAIAGLDIKKIMGYTFVILIVTFLIFGGALLFVGSGF